MSSTKGAACRDATDEEPTRLPFFADADASTGPTWGLREEGYEPSVEHELESRFFVGNGFLGIRGSLDLPTEASLPRTYVAGLFAEVPGPPPTVALVRAPDAFSARFEVDGRPLVLNPRRLRTSRRLLDYRHGVLHSLLEQGLPSGQVVALDSLRFASMAARNLAVQVVRIRLQRPSEAAIYVDVPGEGPQDTGEPAREGALAMACERAVLVRDPDGPGWRKAPGAEVRANGSTGLDIALLTAYGLAENVEQARAAAARALRRAQREGPERLYASHARAWQQRWEDSDVQVEGDDAAQSALRFAVYQLNSAADPRPGGSSVGARGLTGDAYIGHVFWDTEIFMLPFYVLTWPEAARHLLHYRYRTLPPAREKARRLGCRGALFAWESADTGEETTPPYAIGPSGEVIAIRSGDLEHHISAAVAYGVWQYWLGTRDVRFLLAEGAEILLETARFWASRARRERDGFYHIRHVIGPDEYHEDVDDNAYTNAMARWNIERGLEVARLLQRRWPARWVELASKLKLRDEELSDWQAVAERMYLGRDAKTGVPEQFAGFFQLENVDLSQYADRAAPMDVILGFERTRRSQVSKQADVLMLMALLPEQFPREVQEAAFDYYEPRCGHGSSLSPPVHALVAARLGRLEPALRYFRQTAAIDLGDSMGNSAGGIHMASLGGLWQAAVLGFGGVTVTREGLSFAPALPEPWEAMRFRLHWRGRRLAVEVSRRRDRLEAALEKGAAMPLRVYGERFVLERGSPLVVEVRAGKEAGRW
ncbi:MAG TPA: glycosyl hydrolase family 65 protein [Dehalococcoidia bacterium]|nr:glycosyl hydrolase family 65 protein [Dehalococcoidia bacterium]